MEIDSVLGQRVSYPQTYKPDVLVAVPRELNRTGLGIRDDALPFVGEDVWHAYEVSCLTDMGLPVVGVMKLCYSATSRYIVESKSLKLYLNSFNMEKMGATAEIAAEKMRERVGEDLSALLGTEVNVHYFDCETHSETSDLRGFALLERMEGVENVGIEKYTEAAELLEESGERGRMRVKSHLLRSNCRVTHQPDWGTVFIDIEGERLPTGTSLLAYIVSLRRENHFHEEICELIYVRLMERFRPSGLMVCCVYTRRGGIDILPVRASGVGLLPRAVLDVERLVEKLCRS